MGGHQFPDGLEHDLELSVVFGLTSIARSLLKTADSMETPCSVNARGAFRRPPQPDLDIANCDIKILNS